MFRISCTRGDVAAEPAKSPGNPVKHRNPISLVGSGIDSDRVIEHCSILLVHPIEGELKKLWG